jgi:predicted helicase
MTRTSHRVDRRELYRDALGYITKDSIFFYVYGLLRLPSYRTKYAADLKKMLPRIVPPRSRTEFDTLASAGERLAVLYADYESADPYRLDVQLTKGTKQGDRETWRVQKMRWQSRTDHSAIIYNPKVTVAGIPEDAERYMLGARSALSWLIECYQVKTDSPSGIVNDPNDWCDEHDDPTYIVELIKKVTTVSVETMKIVDELGDEETK